GNVTVCRLSDGGEEVIARLPADGTLGCCFLAMSLDGNYIAYGHSSPSEQIAGGVRIWKIDGPTPTIHWDVTKPTHVSAICFRSDGRRLAMGHVDGTIGVYDLQTRAASRQLKIGQVANTLSFHPRDGRLAAACGTSIRLFDGDAGKE